MSKSSATRAFRRSAKRDFDELNGRDLSGDRYCCIMIDGIETAGSHVMVALGFTTTGGKKILGSRRVTAENSEVGEDLIQSSLDRGLCTTPHTLFVLDGAKALWKTAKANWGERPTIQKYQERKIRNVKGYVPGELHDEVERRIRPGSAAETSDEVIPAMEKIVE